MRIIKAPTRKILGIILNMVKIMKMVIQGLRRGHFSTFADVYFVNHYFSFPWN